MPRQRHSTPVEAALAVGDVAIGAVEAAYRGVLTIGGAVGYFALVGLLPFAVGVAILLASVAATAAALGLLAHIVWTAYITEE